MGIHSYRYVHYSREISVGRLDGRRRAAVTRNARGTLIRRDQRKQLRRAEPSFFLLYSNLEWKNAAVMAAEQRAYHGSGK